MSRSGWVSREKERGRLFLVILQYVTFLLLFLTELSRLSPAAMAAHIRELESELYELSQREARELSRSKYLRIFGTNRRRSSK